MTEQENKEYNEFLEQKKNQRIESGFAVEDADLNPALFDFQKYCVKRALAVGKFALFEDCGLGKTIQQLEWAQKVFNHTSQPVLILAPLAVISQTIKEGEKFGYKVTDATGVERINVWDRTDEFFPGGGVLTKSSTNKEGDTIPAGTPVSVEKPGGAATINGANPIGLTYEDAVMGADCCTLTIVTKGVFLVSRTKATVSTAQQAKLPGITFVKEV